MSEPPRRIPFAKHSIPQEAINAASKVIESGWLRQGEYAKKVEDELKQITGAKYAVVMSSCTAALHTCFLLQEKKGKIALPSLTYPATANAIYHGGSTSFFVEIDDTRYTLAPNELKSSLSKKSFVGIAPVHILGIPCQIDELCEIARKKNLFVIEDCAQALGTKYKNKSVGIFGDAGCFSFDPIKPITSGEGGAIVSNNKELIEKAKMLKDNGRDNTRKHYLLGLNYKPTDFQMALAYILIKDLDKITRQRKEIFAWYNQLIDFDGVVAHPDFEDCKQNNIYYTIKLSKPALEVQEKMKTKGIETKEYPPVHMEPAFRFLNQRLPKTEKLCQHLLSLPVYHGFAYSDAEYVVKCLKESVE